MANSRGFTLIEVLVAMLVMAFGLIGLAALQATGIKNIQTSYNRSQAVHLAQEIADRIRANTDASAKAAYVDVNLNGKSDVGETSLPKGSKVPACSPTSVTSGCTPQELAQNDVYQWNLAIKAAFPSGCGSIAQANGTASEVNNGCGGKIPAAMMGNSSRTFIVTINWDEDGDGATGASPGDPNFMMSFDLL